MNATDPERAVTALIEALPDTWEDMTAADVELMSSAAAAITARAIASGIALRDNAAADDAGELDEARIALACERAITALAAWQERAGVPTELRVQAPQTPNVIEDVDGELWVRTDDANGGER